MNPIKQFFSDPMIRKVVQALTRPHEDDSQVLTEAKSLLRNGELGQLIQLNPSPISFETAPQYLEFVTLRDLFRKIDLPNKAAQKAAYDSFIECERLCFSSNVRLARMEDNSFPRRLLEVASRHARRILGAIPNYVNGKHGPGAVFETESAFPTVADKMQSVPTLTAEASIFLPHLAETAWGRSMDFRDEGRLVPQVVKGNRFTTVPKDFTKRRGICIEPSINVYYQLGVGKIIRDKLRRVGIDLNDGQSVHRQAAEMASITGDYTTIDLSNASDTVCRELVRNVLPPDWFELLSALRSPNTFIKLNNKEGWFVLSKFSSMGNGYTFELETLIFYCLILAVQEIRGVNHRILVYGDDIIVHREVHDDVIATLEFCGFQANERKTYSVGPFRESCGGDFFWGADVRPHFQKALPYDPETAISFANGLYRVLRKLPADNRLRGNLVIARLRVLSFIPNTLRSCVGPEALGDIVIHQEDYARFGVTADSITKYRCYKPAKFRRKKWDNYDPTVILACALLGVGDGAKGLTPRDSVAGYKTGWVCYS